MSGGSSREVDLNERYQDPPIESPGLLRSVGQVRWRLDRVGVGDARDVVKEVRGVRDTVKYVRDTVRDARDTVKDVMDAVREVRDAVKDVMNARGANEKPKTTPSY